MANEATSASVQEAPKAGGGAPVLQGRYTIYPNKPLADLNTPTAHAFLAEDRRDPQRPLFALICRPNLPPRTSLMRALKGVQSPGLLQLVEWGPVYWPPASRQCMVVVYERPMGGRVMATLNTEIRRYEDWEVSKRLVAPLAAALRELSSRGVTHRAIRPTNMFYMTGERDSIVLGDCVTAPPGFDQPVLCETIEPGMAHHSARGSGRYSDDMYSLGVSLVLLLLGRNPAAHLDDNTILAQKIAIGTYPALVGDERLPIGSIEVLRGLLCDDVEERWTIDSLDLWLSGRRLSPIQAKLPKRAQRVFHFNGREYTSARNVGVALARHWDEAIAVVLEGKLELWLRRSLEDPGKADGVAAAVRNVTGSLNDRRAASDAMLAKVCMVLDPTAPIRYKGFHAMPDGFGSALAFMAAEQRDLWLITECIMREVPKLWLSEREKYSPENSLLEQNFRELRDFLRSPLVGAGLERCLYALNETLPNQSPLLAEEYVTEIRELLPALDRAAKKTDHTSWPCDRHVVAYMACNLNYDISKQLLALNDPDPAMSALGMLNLFAILQWRLGPQELYGLTSWVGGLLGPVINSYHSRERRRALEREIPRLVRQGSLLELYRFVDAPEERQKDMDGFTWAQSEWAAAEQEVQDLESAKDVRDEAGVRVGKQTAAMASVLIALMTVTVLAIMRIW